MRVNVHDYSGHPFQVQLSRELAARGHEILHTYAAQYVTGHGRLTTTPEDPATLRIEPLVAPVPLVKYSPVARIRFERAYADAWRQLLERERFDLVVSCNVPLFAVDRMRRHFARTGQRWLFWHQDIYSLAIGAEASRRLPWPAAGLARRTVERMEARQVETADGVVAITDAMISQYDKWGVRHDHAAVIPNWAPIDDITPLRRDNAWPDEQGLPSAPLRLLYAGTLGRKHNPLLLLSMLDAVQQAGLDAILVVASQGEGADDLAAAAAGRRDVRVVGYQPAERFSEVLSSADAVIALLEPDAGKFSVPSKVLSYLSAGRPIMALMPGDNPAADDVRAAGGYVGEPSELGARGAALWLRRVAKDPAGLESLGLRARALAERRFDVSRIADEFEAAFQRAVGLPARRIVQPKILTPPRLRASA